MDQTTMDRILQRRMALITASTSGGWTAL